MNKQQPAQTDPEVWRMRAAYWDRISAGWLVLAIVAVATMIVSFLIAADGHDTAVGRWVNSGMRISYGQKFHATALIFNDGAIELHADRPFGLDAPQTTTDASEVSVFLSYRARAHGTYGRTRSTRPLFFHFTVWGFDGNPVTLDSRLRRNLCDRVIEHLCIELGHSSDSTDVCPYIEILSSGQLKSSSTVTQNMRSYFDRYQLQHIRIRGYLHNIITLIAVAVLPLAVIQMIRAKKRSNRWIRLAHDRTCPSCGYDIRNLPQPRCPECGSVFSSRS